MQNNSVPPGFAPHTSFTLKRAEVSVVSIEETHRSNGVVDTSRQEPFQTDATSDMTDLEKVKTSLKDRPWLLFDHSDHTSVEPDTQQFPMVYSSLLPFLSVCHIYLMMSSMKLSCT